MISLPQNLAKWRSEGAALLNGVTSENVCAVFQALGRTPTPDVIAMYAQVGGMEGWDGEGWCLWPLDEILTRNAEPSPLGVYFSDYLANAWCYLLVSKNSFSAVYRDNFDDNPPYQVAPSLEDFFAGYLRNPSSVLERQD